MPENNDDIIRLVDNLSQLVDEIKLLNLNLTIANAKMRLSDDAIHSVSGSFNELIDTTAACAEEAEVALKRVRGEKLEESEERYGTTDIDVGLDKIKRVAEYIIQSVMSIKKGRKGNKQYGTEPGRV